MRAAGITMYAVGVGKAVEDELREIASEPLDKHFFYTTDFTAINQIAENLKLNICAGTRHSPGRPSDHSLVSGTT